MTFPAPSAISTLSQAAAQRQADERLQERLDSVRQLVGRDLVLVEEALKSAVESGPTPAREAAQHLLGLGGKRIRPLSLLLSTACFGEIGEASLKFAAVAELLHSATLLHDDVVDEGMERRGAVAARRLWGNGVSVLAGDLLLVCSLELTEAHGPEHMPDLIRTLRQLIEGEILQLRGRTELDVSEATYQSILRDKTASLFRWSASTGAALGGASPAEREALGSFGEHLGVAFQLVDDVLDYSGEETGKTMLADLAEGKLTLPLVLAVEREPELAALLSRIHAGDRDPVERVGHRVVESGACEEVRRRARQFTELAVSELTILPASPAKKLLTDAARQLAQRAQ